MFMNDTMGPLYQYIIWWSTISCFQPLLFLSPPLSQTASSSLLVQNPPADQKSPKHKFTFTNWIKVSIKFCSQMLACPFPVSAITRLHCIVSKSRQWRSFNLIIEKSTLSAFSLDRNECYLMRQIRQGLHLSPIITKIMTCLVSMCLPPKM